MLVWKIWSSALNQLHAFFVSNTSISNDRLKLAKSQGIAKKHPEVGLLLFENYSHSSSMLLFKNNRTCFKKYTKEQVCLFSWNLINQNENGDENYK